MGAKKNVDKTVTTDTVKILSQEELMVESNSNKVDSKAKSSSSLKTSRLTTTNKSNISDEQVSSNDNCAAETKKEAKNNSQTADGIASTKDSNVPSAKPAKTSRSRSKRYIASRSMVDRTIDYPLADAIDLVTKTSYSKFAGTITADLVVREIGDQGTLTFPHSTGKTVKVEVASEDTLAKLEKGVIDFDILLTEPSFVPKLAKYARLLGPKGLMPNPKNGTITAQPDKRKKELEAGAINVKSERKAPLCHVIIGNTKMSKSELLANAEALLTTLKGRVIKMTLSATMGPGIKVKIEK